MKSSVALTIAALILLVDRTSVLTPQSSGARNHTLTAVTGIKVGHHTLSERPTGCTVILAEQGAVGGVDVRGSAPGTRETDLLNPTNLVEKVNAIVLAGGSAFGLAAADGVVKYLEEKHVGFPTGAGVVPIVPAAILYDLQVGTGSIRPGPDCGYAAARSATSDPVAEGNVGAGAGATVGKLMRADRAMKGGVGSAAIEVPGGLVVAAIVAVNAAGNVMDPTTGQFIAGGRTDDGRGIADLRAMLRGGPSGRARPIENTTIGVVATNATLTKAQATKLAQMAHDGYARSIYPSHLMIDGDAIFTLAIGTRSETPDVNRLGALAADVMSDAIVRAVRAATGIPGYPAARDLK
ncbi:MAG TPA: P1 family peptidase [Vicinamibacterales bacterium]|nr:P1 family peptidase [Vicinamibacterales bacterium]